MPPVHDPGPPSQRSLSGLGIAAFLLFLLAGLAAGVALRHGPAEQPVARTAPEEAAAKPNVVVVMTDDQTLQQMSALPRTRKLIGTRGVKFKRFYVTDPLCCPSRATFLTGQYAHNTGVISNGGPNALAALDEQDTLGVWLQQAGYRTAFVGKYLNDYGLDDPEHVPPGWSEWRALLEPTTQNYFDYDVNENGVVTHYGTAPEDYKTRVIGHQAVDAVRHAARGNRPLFLYVGFNAPHAPSTPAPRDAGSLAGVSAPRTPAFNEDDVSDKPSFLRDRPPLDAAARARIDARNERALESLAEVDRQVAKIVAALKDKQELGNTYIVFTSDNGYLDGEHRIEFGKLLPYEPASQVPLLIRGPGIPAGETSDALVGNIDLAPTIAQVAAAKPTLTVDGHSLLALARNSDRSTDRALLGESLVRDRSTYYGYPYAAIRSGHFLYVDYATGDEELYNLIRDPYELESLADDPAYADKKRALAAALDQLRDCRGQECEVRVQPAGG
ncbi:MAG: N-acetylglucosamine-6-sulfatase [Solirubrobacterales bacterium]|nr:N-acetylglucosamine-6-sulfatase [Solirubrobacterales bacterium]